MGFLYFIKDIFASLGLVVLPLFFALSIVCIITIERIIFYFFIFRFKKVASMLEDVISKHKMFPKAFREDLIDLELEHIYKTLDFGLNFLKFIAGLATMLGLLGTVLGMIDVFSAISTIKTAVSPAVISVGIKKAMFTTAYGLIIGIFALFIQYVFESLKEKTFMKVEEYATMMNINAEQERLTKLSKLN